MMKNSRVVLIRSNPVNPYPRLEKTANALQRAGYSIKILAWDRNEEYKEREEIIKLPDGEAQIVRIGIKGEFSAGFRKNFFPLLKFQIFIYKWLHKHRDEYDIIHAYDFDTGFIANVCAKQLNKLLIYDIPDYYVDSHGLKGSTVGRVIKSCENRVINSADAVIICTEKRKEQIAGTNPKRLAVLHNTPYDKQYKEINDNLFCFDENKLKLAYIGVFGKSRFLDKIAETVIKREDCEFHIGGFGGNMESYFEELSKKYSNIKYYGKISYDKTLYIEKNCDVMCAIYDPTVPNHYYAAPNKFYEALMLGKPLIMAKNTGVDEIVQQANIGAVIDYDVESLNNAIEHLMSRKKEWKEMSERARKLYDEKFSWSVMEKKLLDVYTEVKTISKGAGK